MKLKYRTLALILSVMMIITYMPAIAFAAGEDAGEQVSTKELSATNASNLTWSYVGDPVAHSNHNKYFTLEGYTLPDESDRNNFTIEGGVGHEDAAGKWVWDTKLDQGFGYDFHYSKVHVTIYGMAIDSYKLLNAGDVITFIVSYDNGTDSWQTSGTCTYDGKPGYDDVYDWPSADSNVLPYNENRKFRLPAGYTVDGSDQGNFKIEAGVGHEDAGTGEWVWDVSFTRGNGYNYEFDNDGNAYILLYGTSVSGRVLRDDVITIIATLDKDPGGWQVTGDITYHTPYGDSGGGGSQTEEPVLSCIGDKVLLPNNNKVLLLEHFDGYDENYLSFKAGAGHKDSSGSWVWDTELEKDRHFVPFNDGMRPCVELHGAQISSDRVLKDGDVITVTATYDPPTGSGWEKSIAIEYSDPQYESTVAGVEWRCDFENKLYGNQEKQFWLDGFEFDTEHERDRVSVEVGVGHLDLTTKEWTWDKKLESGNAYSYDYQENKFLITLFGNGIRGNNLLNDGDTITFVATLDGDPNKIVVGSCPYTTEFGYDDVLDWPSGSGTVLHAYETKKFWLPGKRTIPTADQQYFKLTIGKGHSDPDTGNWVWDTELPDDCYRFGNTLNGGIITIFGGSVDVSELIRDGETVTMVASFDPPTGGGWSYSADMEFDTAFIPWTPMGGDPWPADGNAVLYSNENPKYFSLPDECTIGGYQEDQYVNVQAGVGHEDADGNWVWDTQFTLHREVTYERGSIGLWGNQIYSDGNVRNGQTITMIASLDLPSGTKWKVTGSCVFDSTPHGGDPVDPDDPGNYEDVKWAWDGDAAVDYDGDKYFWLDGLDGVSYGDDAYEVGVGHRDADGEWHWDKQFREGYEYSRDEYNGKPAVHLFGGEIFDERTLIGGETITIKAMLTLSNGVIWPVTTTCVYNSPTDPENLKKLHWTHSGSDQIYGDEEEKVFTLEGSEGLEGYITDIKAGIGHEDPDSGEWIWDKEFREGYEYSSGWPGRRLAVNMFGMYMAEEVLSGGETVTVMATVDPGTGDTLTFTDSCRFYRKNPENCSHENPAISKENVVDATDGADGSYDEVTRCPDCGSELGCVAKIEHAWSEVSYETDEHKTSVTASRICKNCKAAESETVALTYTAEKPTCDKAGSISYRSEAFTNPAFEVWESGTEELAALGHDWCEPLYRWSADNTSVTAERVCGNDPAHREKETVTATSADTQPATSEAAGVRTWTSAAFGNSAFEVQTKEEAIPKIVSIDEGKAAANVSLETADKEVETAMASSEEAVGKAEAINKESAAADVDAAAEAVNAALADAEKAMDAAQTAYLAAQAYYEAAEAAAIGQSVSSAAAKVRSLYAAAVTGGKVLLGDDEDAGEALKDAKAKLAAARYNKAAAANSLARSQKAAALISKVQAEQKIAAAEAVAVDSGASEAAKAEAAAIASAASKAAVEEARKAENAAADTEGLVSAALAALEEVEAEGSDIGTTESGTSRTEGLRNLDTETETITADAAGAREEAEKLHLTASEAAALAKAGSDAEASMTKAEDAKAAAITARTAVADYELEASNAKALAAKAASTKTLADIRAAQAAIAKAKAAKSDAAAAIAYAGKVLKDAETAATDAGSSIDAAKSLGDMKDAMSRTASAIGTNSKSKADLADIEGAMAKVDSSYSDAEAAANNANNEYLDWNGTLSSKVPAAKGVKAKAGKKRATVSWKKATKKNLKKFDKVEIQVCTDNNFAKANTTRILVKKTKKSYTVKRLQKKKTYYIRVRHVKGNGVTKLVSKWTKPKRVKIKK